MFSREDERRTSRCPRGEFVPPMIRKRRSIGGRVVHSKLRTEPNSETHKAQAQG